MAITQIQSKFPNIPGVNLLDAESYKKASTKVGDSVYDTVNTVHRSAKGKMSSPPVSIKYALFENESDQLSTSKGLHVSFDKTRHVKTIDKSSKYTPDRTPYDEHFPQNPRIESPKMVERNLLALKNAFAAFIKSAPEEFFTQVTYKEADLSSFSPQKRVALEGQLAAMSYRSFAEIEKQIAKKMSSLPMAVKVLKQAKTLEEFERAQSLVKEAKFWMVAFNARFGVELQKLSAKVQACDNGITLSERQGLKVEQSQRERSEQLNGDYDDLLKSYIAHRDSYSTTIARLNAALEIQFVEPVEQGQSMKARVEKQMDVVQSHLNLLQLTFLPQEQQMQFTALNVALKMLQAEISKIKLVVQAAKLKLAQDDAIQAVFATLVETYAQALSLIAKANSLLPSRLYVEETLVGYFNLEDYGPTIKKQPNSEAEKMLADEVTRFKEQQQRPDVLYKTFVTQQYANKGAKVNDRGGLSLRDYMAMQKLARMEYKESVAA